MSYLQQDLDTQVSGDSWEIKLQLVDDAGTEINVVGNRYYLGIKQTLYSEEILLEYGPVEATGADAVSGIVVFNIPAGLTTLDPGRYFYDIRERTLENKVTTILRGSIPVIKSASISSGVLPDVITPAPNNDGDILVYVASEQAWQAQPFPAIAVGEYTETDPIFTASAASSITQTDIDNWNSISTPTVTIDSATPATEGTVYGLTEDNNVANRRTALGYNAGVNNDSGSYTTAVGYEALFSATASNNTIAIGYRAARQAEGNENVAIGTESLSPYSTTTGENNIAIGRQSLGSGFGSSGANTGIGGGTLAGLTSGSENTAICFKAGYSMTAGRRNTFIGPYAAHNATGGPNDYNFENNTVIGYNAQPSANSGVSNEMTFGNDAVNRLRIPGLGFDTNNATDGQVVSWDSTTGSMVWVDAGGNSFSGSYNDLTDTPTIPSALTDLGITDGTSGQVLTTDGAGSFTFTTISGGGSTAWADITGTPTTIAGYGITDAFDGQYSSLTGTPTLFSGSYNDLTDKPTLFSGSYNDLTDKPTLFSGSYNDLTDKPTLFSGNYNDLTNLPTLFDGAYSSLTGTPTIPTDLTDLGISDGSNGQVLTTDGSGNFSFTTVEGGGGTGGYTSGSGDNLDGAGAILQNFVLNPNPEQDLTFTPYQVNDFGFARYRGATYIQTNASINDSEFDRMFDGRATYTPINTNGATSATDTINPPPVIEINLPVTLQYAAYIGIAFGAKWNRAKGVKLEAFSEGAWVDVVNVNDNANDVVFAKINNNQGVGTTKVRFTLWNAQSGDGWCRVVHLFGYDFNSDLQTTLYVDRSGGEIYGDLNVQGSLTVDGAAPVTQTTGTFTPTVNSGTVTTAAGRWTRVGNQVTVQFLLKGFSDTTNWTSLQITNMPFSGMNEELTAVATCSWKDIGGYGTHITGVMGQWNESKLYFKMCGADTAQNEIDLQHARIDTTQAANAYLRGSITYITNDV